MAGFRNLPVFACIAWVAASPLAAQSAGLQIEALPHEAKLGQSVTLHVSAAAARSERRITLYDGVVPLGTVSLNDRGDAILRTSMLAPGAHSVRAVGWGEAVSASPSVTVTIGSDQPRGFQKAALYPAGPAPGAIAVADFNGDGFPDLVVANAGNGTVTVLLGKPDGTFGDPITTACGAQPTALVAADFDGDGITDLAVTDSATGSVAILRGAGDGTFPDRRDLTLLAGTLSAIVAADFDGDGIPDLAVANQPANIVSILLGRGDGSFQAPQNIFNTGSVTAMAAADLNGDGIADLALASLDGDTVSVLLGAPGLVFQAAPAKPAGDSPARQAIRRYSAAAGFDLASEASIDEASRGVRGGSSPVFASADFNHDGRPDFAIADAAGNIRVLRSSLSGPPDLTIAKSHAANFFQTQTGAMYTIIVGNSGGTPTSGAVTVTDTLPAGLTATAMSGPNWSCTVATLTCTNSGALGAGNNYFAITVTVNVDPAAPASVTNTATVSGGGESNTANDTATDLTLINGPPDLTITKTHSGTFFQNQTGGIYTILVKNTGGGATSGAVTVTDTLPAGMTATAISGPNWLCTLATLTCTNNGSLGAGNNFFPINVTVNVAPNAISPLVNTATVSGGGELDATNDTATDSTVINGPPDLTLTLTHSGTFFQNQTGGIYTILVKNTGGGATSGVVTVTDTLPAGMTATAISGANWVCTLATVTCTNNGSIGVGNNFFPINVTVNVAPDATSPLVNTATVSGGGELDATNDTATDSTVINGPPDLTITKTHSGTFFQNQTGGIYSVTVKNSGGGATSGAVTVTDTLPAGMTATAISGANWVCTLATVTCTNNGSIGVGNNFFPITVTVNVAPDATSPLVNTATVSGGGELDATNDTATDSTVINGPPDLTITKTHSGTFFQNQTGGIYSITVKNTGGGATSGAVTVTDTLPAGMTATAMSGANWVCTLATLTCTNNGSIGVGNNFFPINVTVNVAPNATSPLVNTATVSGGGELDATNDTATDSTVINGAPDLTVTKTHTGNFFQNQVGATYSIVVSNSGGGATSGSTVSVTDTLPAGLTATAISGANWNCTLATLTCTNTGVVAPGSNYFPISVTVNVASNASSPLVNGVTVSGGGETNTANDTATDSTMINGAPDLTITKTHTGNFTQNQIGASYSILVTNSGGGPTNGSTVTVIDTLPAGLTATAISGTNWSCTLATLTCANTGVLPVGGNYFPITVTVNVASNAGSPLVNTATVSGGGETNTANDAATDSAIVSGPPDLTIAKTHTGNFTQGQAGAQYSLTVSNIGGAPASGAVTVADTLPTGLTATAIIGSGWACTLATVSCTRGDALAAAASYPVITVTVSVASNAAASISNSATVSGGGESNTANDTATDPTTIVAVADLTITKTHSGNFTQGQTGATYSIGVTNSGAGPTNGAVMVADTLPAGLTATAISGGGWTCTLATVSCTRNDALGAAASYPAITVTVNVAASASSGTNTATVSGGGELNTANDTATDPTTIVAVADLTITKTHSGNFTQGQTGATYSIGVTNSGAGPTNGAVTVVDTLPAGLTATAIGGGGWACTLATVSCTRNDVLAAAASYPAITVTVNVAGNASSGTNTATVSGGGELNAANDTAADPTTVGNGPDLVIAKTHSGNFTQGQTGATYAIAVTNSGGAATSGAVTVADTLPTGLNATAISGAGWACTLATVSCTRNDALGAAASYPTITVTVNVASNAPASITNSASVSGGADINIANNTASDPTSVNLVADLTITKTHTGNFTQGQTGASYRITVSNSGAGPTNGAVTVADTLPAGFTATAIGGGGWACTLATVSCTRGDALAASASYPAITVTVNVAANASSGTNTATVSGGGELNTANDTAADPTTVGNGPDLVIAKTHSGTFTQGQTGATYAITVTNSGGSATNGAVMVVDTLPAGLTATAISGAGWTCTLATLSCTRGDVLAASAGYPAITVTVNVAANAPASLINTATVSGGGEINTANDIATDPATVTLVADLTITKTHTGNFTQGQTGAAYTILVTNSGAGSTSAAVTVTDALPAALTATAISGAGWSCALATTSCSRNDALAAGASYPAIAVTVNVAANAPGSVVNAATVSGGGELNASNDMVADATTVTPAAGPVDVSGSVTIATSGFLFSRPLHAYTGTLTVTNTGGQPINGPLQIVLTNLTSGITLANATGTALGAPYITVPGIAVLGPGQSATVSVSFSNPANSIVNFTALTFSGSF